MVIIQTDMDKITCTRVLADHEQIMDCRLTLKANAVSLQALSKVLELAANDVRLKILYLLEAEKELCPCDISDILEMSIPAISQHLRKLKDGNIIEARRDAQTIFYSLKEANLKILTPFFRYINQHNLQSVTV